VVFAAVHKAAISKEDPWVERVLDVQAQDLDTEADSGVLQGLRSNLFESSVSVSENLVTGADEAFACFSAPGEGLETVEIARRILELARGGEAFDDIAILLRNPDRYQPMIEDALRRANIPAYFQPRDNASGFWRPGFSCAARLRRGRLVSIAVR